MWELYLITRIGLIHDLSIVVFGLSLVTSIACYLSGIITNDLCNEWQASKFRKFGNVLFVIFGISLIITVITPTKEEAYLIYGVGSTIDYIQDNPKAKQLPDKCIDALDRWVDSLNKEDNKDEK